MLNECAQRPLASASEPGDPRPSQSLAKTDGADFMRKTRLSPEDRQGLINGKDLFGYAAKGRVADAQEFGGENMVTQRMVLASSSLCQSSAD